MFLAENGVYLSGGVILLIIILLIFFGPWGRR